MSLWSPVLFAAVAGAMAAWEWRRYALGKASLHWCPVQGTVVDAWFDEDSWDDDDGYSVSVHLVYDYVVSGRRYRSKRLTYRPTRGIGQPEAYALLQGLRRGQPVDVRYDPEDPQRAVVLPGTDNDNLWRLSVLGLISLVSAGYAFALFLQS